MASEAKKAEGRDRLDALEGCVRELSEREAILQQALDRLTDRLAANERQLQALLSGEAAQVAAYQAMLGWHLFNQPIISQSLIEHAIKEVATSVASEPSGAKEPDAPQAGRWRDVGIWIPSPPRTFQRQLSAYLNKAYQQAEEKPQGRWKHLILRPHPWRHQLSLRDRNMTVRQLVGSIKANGLTAAQSAQNFDLPVEAIEEALQYAEENRELLEFEAEYERRLLEKRGYDLGPAAVPR